MAPVTVVVPSHVAGLQLRRRLGAMGAFAGVRFETLPRIAEIIGAGELASRGRSPLARPIGDYLAAQVALEAREELAGVRELAGFGRVLRQMFRRLRRGGIDRPEMVRVPLTAGYMGELVRLYAEFRSRGARFYDEEDLLDTAARVLRERRPSVIADLGAVYVVPPAGLSAGADGLLRALRSVAPRFVVLDEEKAGALEDFVLAPDPASEAREAAREVLRLLQEGAGLDEIAVFHGADASYAKLLREAFAAAGLPMALMPGVPLTETIAGRAVLALASLPAEDYARTAVMDFLQIAPLRPRIPAKDGAIFPQASRWDRLSRDAGVTKGIDRWHQGLDARTADLRSDLDSHALDADDWWRDRIQRDLDLTDGMRRAIEALAERLEPLREALPARTFIDRFGATVDEYLLPDAHALDLVKAEIEQLGTVGAVGGSFSLGSFVQALRANLEIAALREKGLGEGVLVADYRVAAGLEFKHVLICGAYEGSFPGGPGNDTLVDDAEWRALRATFPLIEDAALRIQRAGEAAGRAMAAAGRGRLTWMAPLFEPGGTREYYASPLMVQAAGRQDASIRSASQLRRAAGNSTLRRSLSPLAAGLRGPAVDRGESALRQAVSDVQAGVRPGPGHRLHAPLVMLRSRRGKDFSAYDGNLTALADGRLWTARAASPTSLETYAACGYRYLMSYVLRLNVVEEPEERDVMEAAERGTVMHEVLDAFFKEKQGEGRPRPYEKWRPDDRLRLRQLAEARLDEARRRGKTGLDIFAEHDTRTILSDLAAFLEADDIFRQETGAVPAKFEERIPPVSIGGVEMRGVVDRIDMTPDGKSAWVIDYKTGVASTFEGVVKGPDAPFAGGSKLQLPAYVTAAGDAERVEALYWFISERGGFERIGYQPTPENQARFGATVSAIVDGIAKGAFPAVPGEEDDYYKTWENCRWCDFSRICSVRRDQDFDLKAADPAMVGWWDVGATARGQKP